MTKAPARSRPREGFSRRERRYSGFAESVLLWALPLRDSAGLAPDFPSVS